MHNTADNCLQIGPAGGPLPGAKGIYMSVVQPIKAKTDDLTLRFLEHCHRRQFAAKATIIRQGDPSHDLFYIVKGSVTVMLDFPLASVPISAGEPIGESIAVNRSHSSR